MYWIAAAIIITGALGSVLSPSDWVLTGFRFLLSFGVGGHYLVSAVMVSESANRKEPGKLVGMVAPGSYSTMPTTGTRSPLRRS